MRSVILTAALLLSGCTTVSAEWQHISHPLLGPPFGPRNQEDTLDVLQVCLEKDYGRYWYSEGCLGQQLTDSGFYGDGFIFTGRLGVRARIGRD